MRTTKPILVVDDDESIREFVSIALTEEGYRVTTAENGHDALTACRREPPAVILLDLWMPVLDGLGFLAEYRAYAPPRAPVIIFAASSDAGAKAAEAQVAAFVAKPVDLSELLAIVGRLCPPDGST